MTHGTHDSHIEQSGETLHGNRDRDASARADNPDQLGFGTPEFDELIGQLTDGLIKVENVLEKEKSEEKHKRQIVRKIRREARYLVDLLVSEGIEPLLEIPAASNKKVWVLHVSLKPQETSGHYESWPAGVKRIETPEGIEEYPYPAGHKDTRATYYKALFIDERGKLWTGTTQSNHHSSHYGHKPEIKHRAKTDDIWETYRDRRWDIYSFAEEELDWQARREQIKKTNKKKGISQETA